MPLPYVDVGQTRATLKVVLGRTDGREPYAARARSSSPVMSYRWTSASLPRFNRRSRRASNRGNYSDLSALTGSSFAARAAGR